MAPDYPEPTSTRPSFSQIEPREQKQSPSSTGLKITIGILSTCILLGGGIAAWYFMQKTPAPAQSIGDHPLSGTKLARQDKPIHLKPADIANESPKPDTPSIAQLPPPRIEEPTQQQLIEQALEQGLALSENTPDTTITPDYPKAIACFEKAAALGSVEADYQLGCLYIGQEGITPDLPKAHIHFQRAGSAGHPHAQSILYELFEKGIGTEKNHTEAIRWLRQAAQKLPAAQLKLAEQYYRGIPPLPQDSAAAITLIKQALEEDPQPESRILLARIYFGRSNINEHDLVHDLIRQDAENGQADAQTLMADIYQEQKGMPAGTTENERYRQIEHWLGLLSEKGDANAAFRLGIHYQRRALQATGNTKNEHLEQARKYLNIAAGLGHKDAAERQKALSAPSQNASSLNAPPSLAGATIRFISSDEEGRDLLVNMKTAHTGRADGYELDAFKYTPNGNLASLDFSYTDTHNPNKLYSYRLIGRNVDERNPYPNPETGSEPPATITFTERQGKTYKGILKGYLVCDRFSYATRFDNVPVTVTFK